MYFLQDGICFFEDVDIVMIDGFGLRYLFIGLFEIMQLNVNGMLYKGGVGWGNLIKLNMGNFCFLCINFDRNVIVNFFKYYLKKIINFFNIIYTKWMND